MQAGVLQPASNTSAVYEAPGLDPKQRWWHVLDNALILPEYLAEVSCGFTAGNASSTGFDHPQCVHNTGRIRMETHDRHMLCLLLVQCAVMMLA